MQHGTASPEALVAAAVAQGASHAALTDRDGLYGAIRHIRSCIAHRVHPIVGVELLLAHNGSVHTATIIAHGNTNGAGWAALCRIVSAAHSARLNRKHGGGEHRRPLLQARHVVSFLRTAENPECTVLLSPESDVGRAIERGDSTLARQLLRQWRALLGSALRLEVLCQYTEPGSVASLRHASRTLALAESEGVGAVLTNAVRYLEPGDVITADLLTAARSLSDLERAELTRNAQAWLKPGEQMLGILAEIASQPSVPRSALASLLRETEQLTARAALDPERDLRWRTAKLPENSVAGFHGDPVRVLSQRAHAGLHSRFRSDELEARPAIRERLSFELDTITRFGYSAYFLTVADVAQLIREMGIRSQARGSGAGSLVNYVLEISQVNPVQHDLLFERFLSSNRETLPDIDIDVESARRHDIYRAIVQRYGENRVTLLSMRTTYRTRSAVRDIGRALGLDEEDVDLIAKSVWRFSARDFRVALEQKPELRSVRERARRDATVDQLIDLTARLDRLPRHVSMHPCGVILSNQHLLSNTPVQPSGLGISMSQFDKDDIDDIGFLKLDVLGVRMQSAMAYAVDEISRVRGAEAQALLPASQPSEVVDSDGRIDLDRIHLDDERTFETIRSTHTIGLFQIESPGQRELLGKLQPTEFEDLIADISLFRPGPMKGNMIAPFVDSRHGIIAPKYLHRRFVSFLAPTYGVVIYHEQVIRIIADVMGVTLSKADEYRRTMSSAIDEFARAFRVAAQQRVNHLGHRLFSDSEIEDIWRVLEGFGSFGFCKAHGAAFALPTYQTAWLKTHFPVEFFAGLLTHDPGMYPKRMLLSEAKRLGIALLPVHVNHSCEHYRVERQHGATGAAGAATNGVAIRMALSDIRHITQAEMQRIVQQQPFTDRADFETRAKPSRRLLLALERIGALSGLEDGVALAIEQPRPVDVQHEVDVLGLDISSHILDRYRDLLHRLGVTAAHELINLPNRSPVLVAGVRVATQTPAVRSGKRVVFITVEDGSGCADATFFDEAQQRAGPLLFSTSLLVIAGYTRRTGKRGVSVLAENAWALRELSGEHLAELPEERVT